MSQPLRNNQKGIALPVAMITLSFVATYIIILSGAYESNLKTYKALEVQTELDIHYLKQKLKEKPVAKL